MFKKLTLSQIILLATAFSLTVIMMPLLGWIAMEGRAELHMQARDRATTAIDMLESVHVNSMLNRLQTEDHDPAVETLNGTME
jgi:hypothetical protein